MSFFRSTIELVEVPSCTTNVSKTTLYTKLYILLVRHVESATLRWNCLTKVCLALRERPVEFGDTRGRCLSITLFHRNDSPLLLNYTPFYVYQRFWRDATVRIRGGRRLRVPERGQSLEARCHHGRISKVGFFVHERMVGGRDLRSFLNIRWFPVRAHWSHWSFEKLPASLLDPKDRENKGGRNEV